jgi:hypothetical protein
MRDVRVQAFHPLRPSAGRSRVFQHLVVVAACSKTSDGVLEAIAQPAIPGQMLIDSRHPPLRFQAAGPFDQDRAGQPEERWERGSVLEPGMALDGHRHAQMTTPRHAPSSSQGSPQLDLYDAFVFLRVRQLHAHHCS